MAHWLQSGLNIHAFRGWPCEFPILPADRQRTTEPAVTLWAPCFYVSISNIRQNFVPKRNGKYESLLVAEDSQRGNCPMSPTTRQRLVTNITAQLGREAKNRFGAFYSCPGNFRTLNPGETAGTPSGPCAKDRGIFYSRQKRESNG